MRDNPIPNGRFVPGYGWLNPANSLPKSLKVMEREPVFNKEDHEFLAFLHISME